MTEQRFEQMLTDVVLEEDAVLHDEQIFMMYNQLRGIGETELAEELAKISNDCDNNYTLGLLQRIKTALYN